MEFFLSIDPAEKMDRLTEPAYSGAFYLVEVFCSDIVHLIFTVSNLFFRTVIIKLQVQLLLDRTD